LLLHASLPVERESLQSAGERLYTVERVLATLELLAFRACSAQEVAVWLQIHPRTARRTLKALAAEEWLIYQPADRQYRLSHRLAALASEAVARSELVHAANAALRRLAERFDGRFDLWTPCYGHIASLVCAASPSTTTQRLEVRRAPRHATAGGKALLAHRARWLNEALDAPLTRYTERTICGADALRAECGRVAVRGLASEDQEFEVGRWGLAAPVFDPTGDVAVAALSITSWAGPIGHRSETDAALQHEAHHLAATAG
jgi:DNA-binding IclR family transcriptional regulator